MGKIPVAPISVEGCKIAAGSYVGTGTAGEAKKNSISLPFAPKMVRVFGRNGPGSYGYQNMLMEWFSGLPYYLYSAKSEGYDSSTMIRSGSQVVEVSENTFFWYYTTDNPNYQMNMKGITYYWIAIG